MVSLVENFTKDKKISSLGDFLYEYWMRVSALHYRVIWGSGLAVGKLTWSQHYSLWCNSMHQQSISPFPLTGTWWIRFTCLGHPYGNAYVLMKPKPILFLELGAVSTHLNLSLSINNSCCDKRRQGFPELWELEFWVGRSKLVFPYSWSQLENDCCHAKRNKNTLVWQLKWTNKILLTGLSLSCSAAWPCTQTGVVEHISLLNLPIPLTSSSVFV